MEVKKTSPAWVARIAGFEGCRLTAYRDASPQGIWTVGVGHTGAGVSQGLTITKERAEQLLASDLLTFEEAVLRTVHVPLNQNQFDALVSFAFNVKGWKTCDLIELVNAGKFQEAADHFPHYCHAGAGILPGLVKRRAAERNLFLSGIGV